VVTVTGFQLYKDANEFYFSHECVQNDGGGTHRLFCSRSQPAQSFRAPNSCRRCDGAGKLTCNKCRGYGYLKKGPDDKCVASSPSCLFQLD